MIGPFWPARWIASLPDVGAVDDDVLPYMRVGARAPRLTALRRCGIFSWVITRFVSALVLMSGLCWWPFTINAAVHLVSFATLIVTIIW